MWRVYGKRKDLPDELAIWDFDTESEAQSFVSTEDSRYTEKTYIKLSREEIEQSIQNLMVDMDTETTLAGIDSNDVPRYEQLGAYGAYSEAEEIWLDVMYRYTEALNNLAGG